ncbi:Xaa-Pro aminopeptidase [Ruminococcaceae bacterium YRB3002]|nr:Xaa-Pro aminopeptidase [Ruminococcaceae bacterium YRB3002]
MVESFISRREKFGSELPDNMAVYLYAGESRQMSQDDDYPFLVDRNFYYLTGLELEGLILVIIKEDGALSAKLYAFPHDDHAERWHGKRPDFAGLASISGLDEADITDMESFEEDSYSVLRNPKFRIGIDGSSIMNGPRRFREQMSSVRGNDDIIDVKDILTSMRLIKSEDEISMISEAAKITEEAIAAMKEDIRPGVTEYELHTRLEYEMKKRGSELFAFATIVSAGRNSFYLHHGIPEKGVSGTVEDGSFVQIDVGARYKGYCADISRVFFVGCGSEEDDKRVVLLDLIRDLRRACWENIRPGMSFNELNRLMHEMTFDFLVKHGLATEDDEATVAAHKYYWHNTSHHLGLDVHDLSNALPKDYRDMPFREGMTLAVEPGVYIPEWNVGFRIEDDVAVTSDGARLISSGNKDDLPEVIFC